MTEQKNKNTVLVIKIKASLIRVSSSVLMTVFIDSQKSIFLSYLSAAVTGLKIYNVPMTKPFVEIINIIRNAAKDYIINGNLNNTLREHINEYFIPENTLFLLEKHNANDIVLIEDFFRKMFKSIFSIDRVEVQAEREMSRLGDFEEIQADNEIDKMTFAKKIEHAKKFMAGRSPLAEKIVQDNTNDMAIIKVTFNYNEYYGAAIIFFNTVLKDFFAVKFSVTKEDITGNINISDPLFEFFETLFDIKNSLQQNEEIILKLEKKIRRTFQRIHVRCHHLARRRQDWENDRPDI